MINLPSSFKSGKYNAKLVNMSTAALFVTNKNQQSSGLII